MVRLLLLSLVFGIATVTVSAQTFPVVLKFSSIGTGVPSDEPVLKYISSFKQSKKIKTITASHIGPMGREGEYYLAFALKSLSKKQRTAFVAGLKKIAAQKQDHGHLEVEENFVFDPATTSSQAKVEEKVL